jgi:TolB protein
VGLDLSDFGLAGLWLRIRLTEAILAVFRPIWAFIGRLGIAIREIIVLFLWEPVEWLVRSFVGFLGRLGIALRIILSAFIWRPLLIISTPLRWLYCRYLQKPLTVTWLFGTKLAKRVFNRAVIPLLRSIERVLKPYVQRMSTRVRERALHIKYLANIRVAIKIYRPSNQESDAIIVGDDVSNQVRINRFTTALITTGLVLILGVITTQNFQPEQAVAQNNHIAAGKPPPITVTPQPSPTSTSPPTVTPTREPQPTLVKQPKSWPTPDPLAQGGSVAFALNQNGNSDIYALTIGRSEPIRLTYHQADDRDPAWSPDGRYIAFSSRRDGNWEIYIYDLHEAQIQRITQNMAFDGGPEWSPDGKWLVFESYRENNLDLYVAPIDGSSTPIRLTENPAQDFSPAWAPDGRHIAFTSWRSGNKEIFLMSLDTASDESAQNLTLSPDLYEDYASFDLNGDHIAYHDESARFDLIYSLPLNDYRPAGPPVSIGQGRHPNWSPDGKSLIYVYANGEQDYLVASTADILNVAPQAFASNGQIEGLAWSAISLPRGFDSRLASGVDQPLFIERQVPAQEESPPHMLWEVDVDAPSPYLNDRVNDSFSALRQRILAEVGWDFLGQLDNMFMPLDALPSQGQSARSWNKAGRAFDFYYLYPISVDPQVEIVREDQGHQTFWRVYLRAANQDGSQGAPLRQPSWDFQARYLSDPQYYDQGGKLKEEIPSGYYVDFTSLAADYGWTRVPANENWRSFFQGIGYWHYENRQGLTWDAAMQEIYPLNELPEILGET